MESRTVLGVVIFTHRQGQAACVECVRRCLQLCSNAWELGLPWRQQDFQAWLIHLMIWRRIALQFTVVTAANLPPKPVLAVHTGNVRRQIKLEAGSVSSLSCA